MATPDVTAGEIMDASASLLNDTAKTAYTYIAQLPYLKMALKELREIFQLHDIPVVQETSSVLTVPASTATIGFNTTPALPTDLVEIKEVWERGSSSDQFIPLTKYNFIPRYQEGTTISQLTIWAWEDQKIKLLPANAAREIKLDYLKTLFTAITDQNSTIGVINCDSFLHYRNAGLCAEFIGENKTRADSLNSYAVLALDRDLGINVKGKQSIVTRRRPFRSSYKGR